MNTYIYIPQLILLQQILSVLELHFMGPHTFSRLKLSNRCVTWSFFLSKEILFLSCARSKSIESSWFRNLWYLRINKKENMLKSRLHKEGNKEIILEREYLFKKNILYIFQWYMNHWLFYLRFNQNFWENRHYLSQCRIIKVLMSNFSAHYIRVCVYIYTHKCKHVRIRVDISRKLR